MKKTILSLLLLGATFGAAAQHGVVREYALYQPTERSAALQPLFDAPLTDVSIVYDGERYYAAGTPCDDAGDALEATRTLAVWTSGDMKAWRLLREVKFDAPVVSPELFVHEGRYLLAFGYAEGGTGLATFRKKGFEGRFSTVRITDEGAEPSLYAEGGRYWWLLGDGRMAPMQADPAGGLAGGFRTLLADREGESDTFTGARGAFLTKIDGVYCLFTRDTKMRLGHGRLGLPDGTADTFVAYSETLEGPYSPRVMAFPHAGAVTLFRDARGTLWSTFSGNDERAILTGRPAAFRVVAQHDNKPAWRVGFDPMDDPHKLGLAPCDLFLRPSGDHILENGVVARLRAIPMEEVPSTRFNNGRWVRDPAILCGPDGNYYMTGTSGDMDRINIWKSKDLKRWDFLTCTNRMWQDTTSWYNRVSKRALLWAPEIHYINGTYRIPWCISGGRIGLLESTTGKAEGPYAPSYDGNRPLINRNIDASLFQDDDPERSVYIVWQGRFARRMDAEFSRFTSDTIYLNTVDGEQVGYEGVSLYKIDGWYVVTAAEWNGGRNMSDGTYDMMYAVSRKLEGPYSRRRVAVPHGGHGKLFVDRDGKWAASMFGNDRTAPFRAMSAVVPLEFVDTGDDLIIRTPK